MSKTEKQSNGIEKVSVLERLNKSIKDSLEGKVPVTEEVKEVAKVNYEELYEKNQFFSYYFASCDESGTFIGYDGETKIVLTSEELEKQGITVSAREKFILLGNKIQLKIVRIDKKTNTVYVSLFNNSMVGNALSRYMHAEKEKVNREIAEILNSGGRPRVWGRIIKVKPNKLEIDILDMGILGFLSLTHWQYGYTRGFDGLVEEGEYYEFEITGHAYGKEGKTSKAWVLSRKRLGENPYKAADAGSIVVGDLLTVKCTNIPGGKSYWWGSTDRIPGVDVMVDFKEKGYSRVEHIFIGIHYICRVKKVEWNEKKEGYNISLVPVRVSSSDLARYNAFARTKRPISVD